LPIDDWKTPLVCGFSSNGQSAIGNYSLVAVVAETDCEKTLATLVQEAVALPETRQRRHHLDWLRAAAVAVVFLYHNARFFSGQYWQLRNLQRSFVVDALAGFVALWLMPLFFLLAGASTRFAVRSQPSGRYLWNRCKRLLVPFIAGIFVLSPPQAYVEALLYSPFRGSLVGFYPRFFAARLAIPHRSLGWFFAGFGYHLWFLGFLFVYSALALPLFCWLDRTSSGRAFVSKLAGWTCGWRLLAWFVPTALVQMGLRVRFPNYLDFADFVYWLVFFLYGYLLFADDRLHQTIAGQGRPALVIGVLSFLGLVAALYAGPLANWVFRPTASAGFMLFQALWSLDAWAWVILILSFASRHLEFGSPVLDYTNEAVLPFYILHAPVVMMIGFFVVSWSIPVQIKFLCLSTLSFVATLAVYDLVVKRTHFTRALFGMKAGNRQATRASSATIRRSRWRMPA
jgi:glucans biosynthesis protein C